MSRVLKNKLETLRENLMSCFKETLPSKQFNATLSLSIIWLHVLVDREAKTEDQGERRRLEDEFNEGRRTIEKGIRLLHEQTKSRTPQDPLLPQELPLP
jgi:hypothetical protein